MRVLEVGLIGCGGFARGMHVPNLLRNPKYHIRAAMDVDSAAAEAAAGEASADYATTDAERVLTDPAIDVVFVMTRHDSHADLSLRAARAGKHVLCEKPMGLDAEECRAVAAAVRAAGVKYTVGYNRGMAPLVTRARELLSDVSGKRMIYHRIQAPFPAEHWTHDPLLGGGRFVGEGCHIFDLLCELIPAPPTFVFAAGGTFLDPSIVHIPDSAVVTLGFADGSVGATLIASDGCASFPKEATEVYCAGRAIHIADFREMECCGFGPESRHESLPATDKGQAIEIDRFADAILLDAEPPNGLVAATRAAVISYKVSESIASGAPVPIEEREYAV